MKKTIRENIDASFSTYDLDGKDRQFIIKIFNDYFDKAEAYGWKNVVVLIKNDYDQSDEIEFSGERLETDKEEESRIKKERREATNKKNQEEMAKKRLIKQAEKLGMKFVE